MPTKKNSWLVDWDEAHRLAEEKLAEIGFTGLQVRLPVSSLSVSHQQMVEIAKAAVTQPKIWVLDEPSAVLSQEELTRLFEIIQNLKKAPSLILYISHRLDEVFEIADRITVLKDGELVGTVKPAETDQNQLIRMMVGRTLGEIYPERKPSLGKEILSVKGLTGEKEYQEVSFSLNRGEILGFFGLVGSGRTQVARGIFGADKVKSGQILLEGKEVHLKSPRQAVKAGIALLTEDRKKDGLVLSCSIADNASLATMDQVSKATVLNIRKRNDRVNTKVKELSVHPEQINTTVRRLSGGNQQKVILAKWLLSQAKILILDEPTRGVDVATKVEIYHLINNLANQGVGIMLISSELPEILGMSDRVLVMKDGHIAGEFSRAQASEESLLSCAAGVAS
jgi:ABC-type sugar transport system ATPase subunit